VTAPKPRATLAIAYSVDKSRWPLVTLRPTSAVGSDSALDATYAAVEELLAQAQRFAVLYDLRGAVSSPARRRRLLDWFEDHKREVTECLSAMAMIVGNGMERGFITATLWVKPPPFPMKVFTSEADAESWLRAECAELF
jgi:hypothetical protein